MQTKTKRPIRYSKRSLLKLLHSLQKKSPHFYFFFKYSFLPFFFSPNQTLIKLNYFISQIECTLIILITTSKHTKLTKIIIHKNIKIVNSYFLQKKPQQPMPSSKSFPNLYQPFLFNYLIFFTLKKSTHSSLKLKTNTSTTYHETKEHHQLFILYDLVPIADPQFMDNN